ncbi:uncharacterized protein ver [Eurosta solidaginis]|uniref:uncharacterized protein ver n=1 Tax=Eurosta solidaginis TaxID=178769 RepID=UPI0035314F55
MEKENDKKPLEYIPLMLCDVRCCSATSCPAIYEVFNKSLQFRTMILHGRVVGKRAPNKWSSCYRFEIDDCTAVLPLIIWQRDDVAEIQRLQSEVRARKLADKRNDILGALQRMLDKTKNQLDPSSISIGNKLFIFGRPDIFCNQLSIYSFIWDIDEGYDRSMELSFKDELLEWYLKRYPV